MVNPNWGLAQGGNNALSMFQFGAQLGSQAREAQERKEYRNALSAYDPNNPETLKPIMAVNPQVGLKLSEDVRARTAERQTAELTQRAVSGDPDALKQLATVNFDRWKALDGQQRDAAKQEAELFGNAAMDILNRPPEQRGAVVQAYAQQLGQQYPEIAQIAQLPPDRLEAALRGAVAEAGMVKELIGLERPSYMAVPYDATLVNTRDPAAVSQFGQAPGGNPPTISDPEQAKTLPPGTQFYTPDGRLLRVPGGPASAPGGFPG